MAKATLRMLFVLMGAPSFLAACSVLKEQRDPESLSIQQISQRPLSPEETKVVLKEVGGNWLYGEGLGDAAMNIGAIAVFPPFAAVVIGNAALSVSGYEPIKVSDALPEEQGGAWSEALEAVTSAPGRFAAAIAGREYVTKEVANERLKNFLAQRGTEKKGSDRVAASNYESKDVSLDIRGR